MQLFNGYQLRMRQNKWYFDLLAGETKLEISYGPFTWREAEKFVLDNPNLIDYDRVLTKRKIDAENTANV